MKELLENITKLRKIWTSIQKLWHFMSNSLVLRYWFWLKKKLNLAQSLCSIINFRFLKKCLSGSRLQYGQNLSSMTNCLGRNMVKFCKAWLIVFLCSYPSLIMISSWVCVLCIIGYQRHKNDVSLQILNLCDHFPTSLFTLGIDGRVKNQLNVHQDGGCRRHFTFDSKDIIWLNTKHFFDIWDDLVDEQCIDSIRVYSKTLFLFPTK